MGNAFYHKVSLIYQQEVLPTLKSGSSSTLNWAPLWFPYFLSKLPEVKAFESVLLCITLLNGVWKMRNCSWKSIHYLSFLGSMCVILSEEPIIVTILSIFCALTISKEGEGSIRTIHLFFQGANTLSNQNKLLLSFLCSYQILLYYIVWLAKNHILFSTLVWDKLSSRAQVFVLKVLKV